MGVRILLQHKMTSLIRDGSGGRVIGLTCTNEGRELDIRARQAVVLGTRRLDQQRQLQAHLRPEADRGVQHGRRALQRSGCQQ